MIIPFLAAKTVLPPNKRPSISKSPSLFNIQTSPLPISKNILFDSSLAEIVGILSIKHLTNSSKFSDTSLSKEMFGTVKGVVKIDDSPVRSVVYLLDSNFNKIAKQNTDGNGNYYFHNYLKNEEYYLLAEDVGVEYNPIVMTRVYAE